MQNYASETEGELMLNESSGKINQTYAFSDMAVVNRGAILGYR